MKIARISKWWFLAILFFEILLYFRVINTHLVGESYEWWTRVRSLDFIGSMRLFVPPQFGGIILPPYFRPLVGWTAWLDTVPLGMKPFNFHVTSLFFHLANTILVGLLGFYLFRKDIEIFILSGLLFAIFPFHSEAVVWSIGGRYDVLATTFYLLSLIGVFLYGKTLKKRWIILVLVSFLLSLLSKESAVTLPVAAFLMLTVLTPGNIGKKLKKALFKHRQFFIQLFLVFSLYFVWRSFSLGTVNPYTAAPHIKIFYLSAVFRWYLLLTGMVFIVYLRWWKIITKIFGARLKILTLLFVLIGLTYLPTANMPTQERQLYLPSAMLVIFIGRACLTFYDWLKKRYDFVSKVLFMALLLYVIFSASFLYRRNENWREAGKLAGSIAGQLADKLITSKTDGPVYLINMPDSVDGAYVYRTHLKEAIETRLGKELSKVVVTPQTIGVDSSVLVVGPKKLILKSREGFALYPEQKNTQGQMMVKNPDWVAILIDKNTLEVEFIDDFSALESVAYVFEKGKIEPL